jgi:transposase InsO family protein
MRLLRRRALVIPQPRKRPRSSLTRFAATLPNELWQTDATHWSLADGSAVEILNVIDDHSRLQVAGSALRTTKAADVVALFHQAALRLGYPAALLSDNAAVFSGASRGGKVLLESELERLGILGKHARPYHPQTCGKVERFHQTQKRWLRAQPAAASLEELRSQLDRFRVQYNQHRPHRALGRRTPQEVFDAKVKAGPGSAVAPVHYRVRYDQVDHHGVVTLRYDSRLHHIGLGAKHRGKSIVLLVADRDVRIVTEDGALLRQLVLDPTRDYQRQSA